MAEKCERCSDPLVDRPGHSFCEQCVADMEAGAIDQAGVDAWHEHRRVSWWRRLMCWLGLHHPRNKDAFYSQCQSCGKGVWGTLTDRSE